MPKTQKKETKKKEPTTITITAKRAEDDYVDVTVNGKEFHCKVFQSGKIKFTYKHPDVDEAMQYEGFVEDSHLWLYPILGEGVLSTTPIHIK